MISKIKRLKQKSINYWFGEVSVRKNYITCLDKIQRLYTISITAWRFKQATLLTEMDTCCILDILTKLETYPKKFHLRLEHGCGVFQEYTFNKYQQKILLEKLKNILETEEFYNEDKEY